MILEKCLTRIFDFLFQFEVMADFVLTHITMGKPIHFVHTVSCHFVDTHKRPKTAKKDFSRGSRVQVHIIDIVLAIQTFQCSEHQNFGPN